MYTLTVSILFFATFCAAQGQQQWTPVLQGPYGPALEECRRIWPEITQDGAKVADCMEKLLFAIAPRLADPKGIEPLGIKSIDPVYVRHVTLADSPVLQGNITDVRAYNATSAFKPQSCKITYDPVTRIAILRAEVDEAVATGKYSITLNLGALLEAGDGAGAARGGGTGTTGDVHVTAKNGRQEVTLQMRESKKRKGLSVAKTDSKASLGKISLKFAPSRENDSLGNLLNNMVTGEVAAQMGDDLLAPVNRQVSLAIGTLFYKGWSKLDEL